MATVREARCLIATAISLAMAAASVGSSLKTFISMTWCFGIAELDVQFQDTHFGKQGSYGRIISIPLF